MAEENIRRLNHSLTLQNREQLQAEGITDLLSFDEENIVAMTQDTALIIKGYSLHIGGLNLDKGSLTVTGNIGAILYDDKLSDKKPSMLSRLFG
jgi:sporulation protein YabP